MSILFQYRRVLVPSEAAAAAGSGALATIGADFGARTTHARARAEARGPRAGRCGTLAAGTRSCVHGPRPLASLAQRAWVTMARGVGGHL